MLCAAALAAAGLVVMACQKKTSSTDPTALSNVSSALKLPKLGSSRFADEGDMTRAGSRPGCESKYGTIPMNVAVSVGGLVLCSAAASDLSVTNGDIGKYTYNGTTYRIAFKSETNGDYYAQVCDTTATGETNRAEVYVHKSATQVEITVTDKKLNINGSGISSGQALIKAPLATPGTFESAIASVAPNFQANIELTPTNTTASDGKAIYQLKMKTKQATTESALCAKFTPTSGTDLGAGETQMSHTVAGAMTDFWKNNAAFDCNTSFNGSSTSVVATCFAEASGSSFPLPTVTPTFKGTGALFACDSSQALDKELSAIAAATAKCLDFLEGVTVPDCTTSAFSNCARN